MRRWGGTNICTEWGGVVVVSSNGRQGPVEVEENDGRGRWREDNGEERIETKRWRRMVPLA
eukprot:751251-Hanusia_phi.AAC.1